MRQGWCGRIQAGSPASRRSAASATFRGPDPFAAMDSLPRHGLADRLSDLRRREQAMQEQKGLLVLAITMLVAACLLWAGIPTLTPAVGPASSPRASNNALTAQLAAGESSDKAVNDRTLLTSVEP